MREYYLPFLFVAVFIGYEISFYLFYQYQKVKDKNIPLNKLLIAYSLLAAFGISAVLIRTIRNYYIDDIFINYFFYKSSHIIIAFGTLSFLSVIYTKSFNEVINIWITRSVIITATIFLIVLIFIRSKDLELLIILISIAIGASYLIYSNFNLIKNIHGKAKKRIFLILIGFIVLLGSVIFRADEFIRFLSETNQILIEFITIPLMLIGLLIILFGVYRFPILLEFNWQEKFIELFIVDTEKNEIIYFYNPSNEKKVILYESNEYPAKIDIKKLFFSKGISDIEDFISDFIDKNESIQKITHGNQIIFTKHGDNSFNNILYCIIALEDMNSISFFLNSIKKNFQKSYKSILSNTNLSLEDKKKIFIGFDKYIRNFIG